MILEDLLMVLSCLALHILWKVQAVPILPLSLVPDTFDDAYVGCSEEMEEKAGLLLKEEMARHALLRESWEAAQEAWAHGRHKLTLPPGFKAQHGVAVMVYTNSSNTLYWELNQAGRRDVAVCPQEQQGSQSRSPQRLWLCNQGRRCSWPLGSCSSPELDPETS
ncbi:ADP-ribosyltransferase 5, isoform CRA_c [Rattus norvegicus]|uniref:NAD(P)(+)--arginine ADP-ribosyltransferase n=1 Tax=Rattus norvegicus TaxID=10116 RepID=A6I711_RAT|nr:ADP-ribosyltransferase 5, isoform CRA_c [Rattus norvegicus]